MRKKAEKAEKQAEKANRKASKAREKYNRFVEKNLPQKEVPAEMQPSENTMPKESRPQENSVPAKKTHTVKSGDTLYSISRKYGISVDDIYRFNPGVKASELKIGTQLKVE